MRPHTGGNKPRVWSAGELQRMRQMVEAADLSNWEIGRRFRCGEKTIAKLAAAHGWRVAMHDRRRQISPAHKASVRATAAAKRREAIESLPERMAASRCRVLTGREFARRKAELEARDRGERAHG